VTIGSTAQIAGYRVGIYGGGLSGTLVAGAAGFIYNFGTIQQSETDTGAAVRLVSGGRV
jgi:hypothetical protein